MLEGGYVRWLLFQNSATNQLRFISVILSQEHCNEVGLINHISWQRIECVTNVFSRVVKLLALKCDQPGQMPCFCIRGILLKDLKIRGRGSVRVTGKMALVPISELALDACGCHGSSLKQPGGNSCRYRTTRLLARTLLAHASCSHRRTRHLGWSFFCFYG